MTSTQFKAALFSSVFFCLQSAYGSVIVTGIADGGITVQKLKGQPTKAMLANGKRAGNAIGILGSEELSGNNKLSFRLIQGYIIKNGDVTSGPKDGAFNKQSSLALSGDWGEIAAGRFGSLMADTGNYTIIGGLSAYGTNYQAVGSLGGAFVISPRVNNALVYVSPFYKNINFTAMYSNGMVSDDEAWSNNNHYYGVASTYKTELSKAMVSFEFYDHKATGAKSAQVVTTGFAHNFGAFTGYVDYQFAHRTQIVQTGVNIFKFYEDSATQQASATQNALSVSISVPLAGGSYLLQSQGAIGKFKNAVRLKTGISNKYKTFSLGTGYLYPLSKRSTIYLQAAYGWAWNAYRSKEAIHTGLRGFYSNFGLCHLF